MGIILATDEEVLLESERLRNDRDLVREEAQRLREERDSVALQVSTCVIKSNLI